MKPYQKLQRHWRDMDATISTVEPGEEAVGRLEERYGIRFPDDFRDYLLHSCPKDDGWDGFSIWWCLKRLKSVAEECPGHEFTDAIIVRDAAKFIVFADYSMWCWAWAIDCGEDENRGRVVVISGQDRFVADSFAEFVDRFIEDQMQLA